MSEHAACRNTAPVGPTGHQKPTGEISLADNDGDDANSRTTAFAEHKSLPRCEVTDPPAAAAVRSNSAETPCGGDANDPGRTAPKPKQAKPSISVAVVGGREFANYAMMVDRLDELAATYTLARIVSGGARGADRLGARYARERSIPLLEHLPDWSQGRGAGFLRNRLIVRDADVVVAFWDGHSRGTKHTIDTARNARPAKRVYVHHFRGGRQYTSCCFFSAAQQTDGHRHGPPCRAVAMLNKSTHRPRLFVSVHTTRSRPWACAVSRARQSRHAQAKAKAQPVPVHVARKGISERPRYGTPLDAHLAAKGSVSFFKSGMVRRARQLRSVGDGMSIKIIN
jgi:hypothetical protein